MSTTHIPTKLRRDVVRRAGEVCEYCRIHCSDAYFGCEIDHIISEKHGGPTTADNLALACLFCNQAKGSDVGSVLSEADEFVRFFNPRRDHWSEHFALREDLSIQPLTAIGQVTVNILKLNAEERVLERRTLRAEERYPPSPVNE